MTIAESCDIVPGMKATVQKTIDRIRDFAGANNWTKTRMAREAGLPDTTLRHFDNPSWNPTAETLRKLEAVIPEEWVSENCVAAEGDLETAAHTNGEAA